MRLPVRLNAKKMDGDVDPSLRSAQPQLGNHHAIAIVIVTLSPILRALLIPHEPCTLNPLQPLFLQVMQQPQANKSMTSSHHPV